MSQDGADNVALTCLDICNQDDTICLFGCLRKYCSQKERHLENDNTKQSKSIIQNAIDCILRNCPNSNGPDECLKTCLFWICKDKKQKSNARNGLNMLDHTITSTTSTSSLRPSSPMTGPMPTPMPTPSPPDEPFTGDDKFANILKEMGFQKVDRQDQAFLIKENEAEPENLQEKVDNANKINAEFFNANTKV